MDSNSEESPAENGLNRTTLKPCLYSVVSRNTRECSGFSKLICDAEHTPVGSANAHLPASPKA